MKNSINKIVVVTILPLVLGSMFFLACEDQLVQEPRASIVAQTYYKTEAQAFAGLVGIYNKLQEENVYGVTMYRYTAGASDDMTGNSGSNSLNRYTIDPTTSTFNSTWNALYNTIHRANILIVNVKNADEISQPKIDLFIAEAKFLRALSYFHLVNLFGGVPLLDEPVLPGAAKDVPRSSVSEVYSLIESDLKEAESILPPKTEVEYGRATKGAAQALLAKAYLHQEKWADAVSASNRVIDSGIYSLHKPYYQIFRLDHENHSGQIFSIVYSTAGPQGWGNGNEGNEFSIWFTPGGWGGSQPTEALEEAFDPDDERLKATVVQQGDKIVVPGHKIVSPDYELQDGESFDESRFSGGVIPARGYGKLWTVERRYAEDRSPLDWPVLRYADVLLMKAEALAELNDLSSVQEPLTKIRNRAGLSDYDASGKSQQQVIEDVRLERQRELALDGYRLYDLRRWGIVVETIRANVIDPNLIIEAGKHELYPIPQVQIDLSEGTLTQNPGYF